MAKYLITIWNNCILTALYDGKRVISLDLEPVESSEHTGNIYLANVGQVVKNLNAAFVQYEKDKKAYCPLAGRCTPYFQNEKKKNVLVSGDKILVQIEKDAIKTKDPVATTDLSLVGRYVVLDMAREKFLNFSKKISDKQFKDDWNNWISEKQQQKSCSDEEPDCRYGFILRTNAYGADKEIVYREMCALEAEFNRITTQGLMRTCYSKLYQAPPIYIRKLMDAYDGSIEEIVTDSEELYQNISALLEKYPEMQFGLRKYADRLLPLYKLYALETAMQEALSERVWLKSGGYLVIQQTEACTVVDVNSGKYEGKKNKEDTFFKINLEAAKEVAIQLRLRNLSGIIIVDFINMQKEENNRELMRILKDTVAHDPVPVTVVDMTKLQLVELTRKKERKPFSQQYKEVKSYNFDTT